MVAFIRYTVLFGLLLVSWMGLNFLFNYYRINQPVNLNASTIIAGDSHLMSGVNPSAFEDATNVCIGAESYLITFYKLKRILKDNPEVKKVLLGFSYNNFSAYQDDKITTAKAKSQFNKYYPVLPLYLPKVANTNSVKFYHTFVEKMMLYPNFDGQPYIGKFQIRNPELGRADLNVTLEKHYLVNGQVASISEVEKTYLDSIVFLCRKNTIDITLIGTPLHPKYIAGVPKNIVEYWNAQRTRLAANGIRILNYIEEPFPDQYFFDYDHLSLQGADVISKQIISDLAKSN